MLKTSLLKDNSKFKVSFTHQKRSYQDTTIMGVKLQLLCVFVVLVLTIQQASCGGCQHGQHDPPDPAKSHKLPCKRPDALIHCPCPNCDQQFEDAEQMQQHIDHHHPDCYYCRREGIGGRGPDSPVSCRCENDDDHLWSDSDFPTVNPLTRLAILSQKKVRVLLVCATTTNTPDHYGPITTQEPSTEC